MKVLVNCVAVSMSPRFQYFTMSANGLSLIDCSGSVILNAYTSYPLASSSSLLATYNSVFGSLTTIELCLSARDKLSMVAKTSICPFPEREVPTIQVFTVSV